MTLAYIVVIFAPRVYQSEARLMLRVGRESVRLDPTAGDAGDAMSLHRTREHEIQSAIGVMHSREILDRVVDDVGVSVVRSGVPASDDGSDGPGILGTILGGIKNALINFDSVPEREIAVRSLSEGISISAPTNSSVVSISYATDSPEIAQSVVDSWVDAYVQQHAKVHHTQGAHEFFARQGETLRQNLDEARAKLQKAKNEYKLVTIEGTQKMLEEQLTRVRDGLLEVETEIAAKGSRIQAFDKILKHSISATITEETSGMANEARDQMRSQLFALEVTEKDLRSKLTPEHPRLVAVQRQLEEARSIVGGTIDERKEVRESANPAHQQLSEYFLLDQADQQGLLDKRKAFLMKQSELVTEMANLNDHERLVAALKTDVEILDKRYNSLADKLEQARLDKVLEKEKLTSVSVVQPATFEMRPVSPNKALCGIVGFLAASAIAISLPVLLEVRDLRFFNARGDSRNWEFESFHEPSGTNSQSISEIQTTLE